MSLLDRFRHRAHPCGVPGCRADATPTVSAAAVPTPRPAAETRPLVSNVMARAVARVAIAQVREGRSALDVGADLRALGLNGNPCVLLEATRQLGVIDDLKGRGEDEVDRITATSTLRAVARTKYEAAVTRLAQPATEGDDDDA